VAGCVAWGGEGGNDTPAKIPRVKYFFVIFLGVFYEIFLCLFGVSYGALGYSLWISCPRSG